VGAAALPILTGFLSVLLGMLVGLSLGLVGAGGSILTVPALIYGLGIPVREAIPAALILVGLIAANGAMHHSRKGTVRLDIAVRFGLAGMIGAVLGARLSEFVQPRTLMILFAFVMLAAAISLARRDAAVAAAEPVRPFSTRPGAWTKLNLAGLAVGLLTGFFGVGGGFVIVPVLALFVGLSTREAVATSLVVIVMNCVGGLAGHLTLGPGFSRTAALLLGLFALGGAAGSGMGVKLAGRWPETVLSRIFATIVAGLAVYLLVRNISEGPPG
jgi:uncharacterized membrane protein YfcA